jgi:multidrug efflux pump subunit AcrA (membrane-fusion protein)
MASDKRPIPIPWNQRLEQFQTVLAPVLCLAATLIACGWLWQRQTAATPAAVGQVYAEIYDVRAPADGELLGAGRAAERQWRLYDAVHKGEAIAQITKADGAGIEITSPIDGVISLISEPAGQIVRRGDSVLRVASPSARYIVCYLPDRWQRQVKEGTRVAVREHSQFAVWADSTIESVGAAIEPTPDSETPDAQLLPDRGLPVRIGLPNNAKLRPGALVDVRILEGA